MKAKQWTSLAALALILLIACAADSAMEAIGPSCFLAAGAVAVGAAYILVVCGDWHEKQAR